MSLHSYSICYTHFVFTTLNRDPVLNKEIRILLSGYFDQYSKEKKIYQKINFVNQEHVHMLINLPTNLSVEKVIQLYKGSSSYWINNQKFLGDKFYWERGYGVFFVSGYNVEMVSRYIAKQEEHHKKISCEEEFKNLLNMKIKIK